MRNKFRVLDTYGRDDEEWLAELGDLTDRGWKFVSALPPDPPHRAVRLLLQHH